MQTTDVQPVAELNTQPVAAQNIQIQPETT